MTVPVTTAALGAPLTAPTRSGAAREHIRRVALTLFVDQGFQAVSLRQLAAAAGMQAGSLYNHFESKQALLFELIDSYETELLQALPSGRLIDTDPLKALGSFVRAYLQFCLRQASRSRLTRLEFRCLAPEQQTSIEQLRTACAQRLIAILRHGIERQVFKPLPLNSLVPCLLSLLNDVGTWHGPQLSLPMSAVLDLHMKMIGGVLSPDA